VALNLYVNYLPYCEHIELSFNFSVVLLYDILSFIFLFMHLPQIHAPDHKGNRITQEHKMVWPSALQVGVS